LRHEDGGIPLCHNPGNHDYVESCDISCKYRRLSAAVQVVPVSLVVYSEVISDRMVNMIDVMHKMGKE